MTYWILVEIRPVEHPTRLIPVPVTNGGISDPMLRLSPNRSTNGGGNDWCVVLPVREKLPCYLHEIPDETEPATLMVSSWKKRGE